MEKWKRHLVNWLLKDTTHFLVVDLGPEVPNKMMNSVRGKKGMIERMFFVLCHENPDLAETMSNGIFHFLSSEGVQGVNFTEETDNFDPAKIKWTGRD